MESKLSEDTSRQTLQYFMYFLHSNCSETRKNFVKIGQPITNALKFQKTVHYLSKEPSPISKILPKYYPVPKKVDLAKLNTKISISPIKYLDPSNLVFNNPNYATPAMQEYINSTKYWDIIEHKKLTNIESFFIVISIQERFQAISKKIAENNLVFDEISLKKLRNNIKTLKKTISESETKQESLSRMMRKLLEADEIIEKLVKEEACLNQTLDSPETTKKQKKTQSSANPLNSKFTVLNQKANKCLKSLLSQSSVSTLDKSVIEGYYKKDLKDFNEKIEKNDKKVLPSIKRKNFYDPTPLPAEFKLNKELMIIY